MARNGNSKPTKELILDAAFSFLNEMHYNTFSMNELAAKVGISKPAIYRHFKNKEDVLNAMENRVIMGSAPFLKKISSGDSSVVKNALSGLIQHFIENTTHINFFIASMSSMPNYEERLYTSLYDNEVSFLKNESYFKKFAEDMGLFSRHVFCGMSIFFFVKVMERMRCEGKLTEIPPQFSDKIVSLLYGGLRGNTEESNMLHPEPISDERKKELVALCEIKPEVFPEENRIFTALAAVIEKYTMTGVTVERIADELRQRARPGRPLFRLRGVARNQPLRLAADAHRAVLVGIGLHPHLVQRTERLVLGKHAHVEMVVPVDDRQVPHP